MASMSYCRFRNTRSDMDDCLTALRTGESLSADEARAGSRMFEEFLSFCRENGIIDGYDDNGIEALFDGRTEKEDSGD